MAWARAIAVALLVHALLIAIAYAIRIEVPQARKRQLAVIVERTPEARSPEPAVETPPPPAEEEKKRGATKPPKAEEPVEPAGPALPAEEPKPSRVLDPYQLAEETLRPRAPPIKTATAVMLEHEDPGAPEKGKLAEILAEPKPRILYEAPRFQTHISPDGTIRFKDRFFQSRFSIEPTRDPNGEDPLVNTKPVWNPLKPEILSSRWPDLADRSLPELSFQFRWGPEPNEMILRAIGDDPYAYEKNKIMEETRPMRIELMKQACTERLRRALSETSNRLASIWSDPALTIEEKRRAIFDLWDECAEEGSPEVVQTAEMIRATIVAFVQDHLPSASTDAYPPRELALLNERRRSRLEFRPYGE